MPGAVILACLMAGPVPLALPATAAPAEPAGPAAGAQAASIGPDGDECMPPADTVYRGVAWAQQRLDPQRVWGTSRGSSATVAVVDTGVSRAAPALAGRVLPGRDVRSGGSADSDCAGHGTFVAGLIAARQVDEAAFAGLAPDARILPIRVSDRADDVHPDLLAEGIEAAVQGGATVVAVVCTAPFGSPALRRAVALANRRGVLVVAAAVTMRAQQDDVAYPAALPGVVSVMGVASDGQPANAPPSSHPTLAAPGKDLVSIGPGGRGNVKGSGVNLAVGYVAGTAALVRGYLPRLPVTAVRDRLMATADPVSGSNPLLGSGVINPVAAVTAVVPAASERVPDPPKPEPVLLPPIPVVDHRPARAAAGWAAGVILAGMGLCLAGPVLVRGRRRGWSAASDAPGRTGQALIRDQ